MTALMRRRQARIDREPMEPDHGRPHGQRGRRRRSARSTPPRSTPPSSMRAALRSLVLQLALLTVALALTFGAMMAVGRRVITPLHNMRDAMLKVAAGDLTVDTGYGERHDEIGALAGALETFKQQAAGQAADRGSRSANATPAPRRARRRSRPMSASSRAMVRQTPAAAGRRLRPDADHLLRAVGGLPPDQPARPGRREGLRRGLDQRRERRFRRRATECLDQRHQPAGRACRRHRQPRRRPGAGNRRHRAGPGQIGGAGSAKWSA